MSALMPPTESSLTFPVAALARLDAGQPCWLRQCLATVQDEYLRVAYAADSGDRRRRELMTHEAEACRELLVEAWMDAICPLPVFGGSAFGGSVFGQPSMSFVTGGTCIDQ